MFSYCLPSFFPTHLVVLFCILLNLTLLSFHYQNYVFGRKFTFDFNLGFQGVVPSVPVACGLSHSWVLTLAHVSHKIHLYLGKENPVENKALNKLSLHSIILSVSFFLFLSMGINIAIRSCTYTLALALVSPLAGDNMSLLIYFHVQLETYRCCRIYWPLKQEFKFMKPGIPARWTTHIC